MELFNPLNVCTSPNEMLARIEDSRHRKMIKNYRRHAMLEVAGRWQEILKPDMLSDQPQYRMFYMGQSMVLTGTEQVAGFYEAFDASGGTVFGPLEERMAVADWGIALESYFGHHLRGHQLEAMGVDVPDSQGFYQFEHWLSSFWPYDESCRLIGEHIYENPGTRVLHAIDEAEFVTPEMANEILSPLIDSPEYALDD